LLEARSRLDAASPEVLVAPFVTQPDKGHPSLKTSAGLGWRRNDWFEEFSVRAGYHDLLDPDPGYTPDAQIDILTFSLRHYQQRHRVRLERLTLVDAISLSPMESLFFSPSWKGRAGLQTLSRDRCQYCQNFVMNGGIGLALQTQWLRREVYFLFPELDANVSRGFTADYRIGGGGTAGLLLHLTGSWKVMVLGTYLRYPLGETGAEFRGVFGQQLVLYQNWALRSEFRYREHDNEAMLLVQAYF